MRTEFSGGTGQGSKVLRYADFHCAGPRRVAVILQVNWTVNEQAESKPSPQTMTTMLSLGRHVTGIDVAAPLIVDVVMAFWPEPLS